MRAIVRQNGVDSVRNGLDQVMEEVGCDSTRCFPVQLDEGELRGPVDGDQEIELPLGGLHLCDIDMEEADGYALNFFFVTFSPPTSGRRPIPWR